VTTESKPKLLTGRFLPNLTGILAAIALLPVAAPAQTPASGAMVNYTATTDNVVGVHDPVRIDILRWSTDAERDQLATAWTQPNPPPSSGRGGRGAGRGAPAEGGATPAPAAPAAAGRGRGRGAAAPAPPKTPETALADAIEKTPVVGYLWTSEVAGYALHFATRLPEQNGGERILLITDRRLGAWNDLWKPTGSAAQAPAPAMPYEFSVVEIHLNSKGEGEGKASLTGKIAFDSASKLFSLENYAAEPVVLKGVKRRAH
jgi:hypothetical protein